MWRGPSPQLRPVYIFQCKLSGPRLTCPRKHRGGEAQACGTPPKDVHVRCSRAPAPRALPLRLIHFRVCADVFLSCVQGCCFTNTRTGREQQKQTVCKSESWVRNQAGASQRGGNTNRGSAVPPEESGEDSSRDRRLLTSNTFLGLRADRVSASASDVVLGSLAGGGRVPQPGRNHLGRVGHAGCTRGASHQHVGDP